MHWKWTILLLMVTNMKLLLYLNTKHEAIWKSCGKIPSILNIGNRKLDEVSFRIRPLQLLKELQVCTR